MIENPRYARVREIARLAQKDARTESGLFLLEGPQAVREALAWRPELIEEMFITDEASYKHEELCVLATEHGIAWEPVTLPVIEALADTRTPQGVVAVCRQAPVALRRLFTEAVPEPRLVAILEEVRDPGNLGTIIRIADAAGADAVILSGRSVDLYNPKVVRSTTGSIFHLPIVVGVQLDEVLAECRLAGLWIGAAALGGQDITELRATGALDRPTAWLFGNEARGLTPEHIALADDSIQLPIYGKAESLNLAMAAAVFLYESAFAQRN